MIVTREFGGKKLKFSPIGIGFIRDNQDLIDTLDKPATFKTIPLLMALIQESLTPLQPKLSVEEIDKCFNAESYLDGLRAVLEASGFGFQTRTPGEAEPVAAE